jgi:hypothetical protein
MSRLSNPNLKYHIPVATLVSTLRFLRQKGEYGHEGVVLWPGYISDTGEFIVKGPIIPKQITGRLYFRIPNDEVFNIIEYTSERGWVIPIQVHSHPQEAFHSPVDDERAFVQHVNAISIVIPYFGNINISDFIGEASCYRLVSGNNWAHIPDTEISKILILDDNYELA